MKALRCEGCGTFVAGRPLGWIEMGWIEFGRTSSVVRTREIPETGHLCSYRCAAVYFTRLAEERERLEKDAP